ncbi:conserved unknown protein [Ectocarpus siliculosus]|uniref:Uncharacterized protein n=1 Tax=Ectocarpus siliculosus TaxID=2880 RepID=D7FNS3_ECTSI|nr:conserved unknown protein [Ectocarpus siliculosus]|eukprot:CBJ26084.1 conserved unknown protein [Ectocarpus siliculosus]
MDENTRFLQGVTKHGGAWARLAQKHTELGVVAVEESEGEDGAHASRRNNDDSRHVDEGRDSDGVGGDKPRTSLAAGPAGEGTKQPGKKARKGGDKGSKQGKDKKKQKSRRGSSEWDDEEHERFVKGFERHGKAWAEVAQVVRTRDEGQVQGYSARWVTRTGGLHESFRKIGEWEGDEHDRFMEGVKLYGRSWVDVASVVRTRTNRQVIMHAMHRLNDDLSSKPSLRACTSTGPQATDRAPPPAQPRAAVNGGDWGDDEHEAFMKGVKIYGRSWVSVARLMGTRTNEQVRAHAKQYLNKDLTEKRPWRSKRSKSTTPPVPKAPTPCRKVAAAASPASGVGVSSAPASLAPSSVPARPARRKAAAAAAARIESTTAGGDADGGGDEEEEEGGGWSKRARLPGEVGGGAHEEGHTQDKSAGKKKKAKKTKKKKKKE